MKLMAQMLQNLFPSINVSTVNLSDIRRVCLFHYNDSDGSIGALCRDSDGVRREALPRLTARHTPRTPAEFRHYDLSVKAVGISKSVKSIIGTNVPDLSQYDDISDFITKCVPRCGGAWFALVWVRGLSWLALPRSPRPPGLSCRCWFLLLLLLVVVVVVVLCVCVRVCVIGLNLPLDAWHARLCPIVPSFP